MGSLCIGKAESANRTLTTMSRSAYVKHNPHLSSTHDGQIQPANAPNSAVLFEKFPYYHTAETELQPAQMAGSNLARMIITCGKPPIRRHRRTIPGARPEFVTKALKTLKIFLKSRPCYSTKASGAMKSASTGAERSPRLEDATTPSVRIKRSARP